MPDLLIATDAKWVHDEVEAAVGGPETTIRWVRRGVDVLPAVLERVPDLAVVDLQIGNMGGMAVCLDLRLEESAERIPHVRVLMLLDRQADVFLAKRSGAEGWLVKPLDPVRLGRAVNAVLAGATVHEGESPAPAGGPTTAVG